MVSKKTIMDEDMAWDVHQDQIAEEMTKILDRMTKKELREALMEEVDDRADFIERYGGD